MSDLDQPSTTTPPSIKCTFLSLPPEIRQLIYKHLFLNHKVIVCRYYIKQDDTSPSPPPPLDPSIAIFLTNKIIHQESRPIFLSQTTFHLKPESLPLTTKRPSSSSSFFSPTPQEIHTVFNPKTTAQHVRHIHYNGNNPRTVFTIHELFPNLTHFSLELGEDFFHSDQTNFDRAMRNVLRYGEWKPAVRTALDEAFPSGMRDAVARLRHLRMEGRGFRVTLHWGMAYRFIRFIGIVDLDEWVLRIWDPDKRSTKVYEIPQTPLEPTWCDGRLTLPAGPGG